MRFCQMFGMIEKTLLPVPISKFLAVLRMHISRMLLSKKHEYVSVSGNLILLNLHGLLIGKTMTMQTFNVNGLHTARRRCCRLWRDMKK